MEDIFILGRKVMAIEHIFNKEIDSQKLAMEIVEFLRKWGMWKDVQIFTGGKCYTDSKNGELKIRDEVHPEKYTTGLLAYEDCNGEALHVEKDFSNPERLLDMTFEGPLYLLLRHHEYEVSVEDVSEEAKHIILPEKYMDEVDDLYDGEEEFEEELFFDGGRIANQIFHEFDELLEKYGLRYELCFSWGLTTYRIGEFSLQNYCII